MTMAVEPLFWLCMRMCILYSLLTIIWKLDTYVCITNVTIVKVQLGLAGRVHANNI